MLTFCKHGKAKKCVVFRQVSLLENCLVAPTLGDDDGSTSFTIKIPNEVVDVLVLKIVVHIWVS